MSTGVVVLLVAVAVTVGYGVWRARSDGRFGQSRRAVDQPETPAAPEPESVLAGTPWADGLGERATLLQFSSAFCAPCRATRQVLGQVAEATPGVVHVEVDAEHHLALVRRLGILRTPTTLVLDATGREVSRAGGAPTRDQVTRALSALAP